MLETNNITKRERDCLVLLREHMIKGFPLRLHEIASTMQVKPPTALGLIKRLKSKNLVDSRSGMVILTETGAEVSDNILMVHRTFESLFCQSGISEMNACEEAGEIDFLIPARNAKKVLKRIDSPKFCPHGKPIHGD